MGGKGRFGHDRGELIVSRGDFVLLAPRVRNDYGLEDSLKRWDLLWAYFFPHGHWHDLLQWPEEAPGLMRLRVEEDTSRTRIVKLLAECNRLNTSPRRHRELLAMNILEKAFLCCDDFNPVWDSIRFDPRILRAMEYVCKNLDRPTTITSIAEHCGISGSRLAHLFRSQSGQTVHQFLEQERIARARQLLELTQDSITGIAEKGGFVDLFHFSRRFKHYVGISPRGYRQRLGSFLE
jgi:AraC family transcriptional regulator of arabinose operon